MTTTDDDVTDALRRWARGVLPVEAAVHLLIDAVSGRLLHGPWMREDADGHCWFDPSVAATEAGVLSGGERRVLAIATSLAAGTDHPVDLGDAVTGLDPETLAFVLETLGHAGGLDIGRARPMPPNAVVLPDTDPGEQPASRRGEEGGGDRGT
ncbi:MAG: hypothetical protein ACTH2Q_01535 [Propionibacteriaceae bacterium]